jgi:hypothetical protein
MVGLQPESVAGAAIEPTLAAPMALPLALRALIIIVRHEVA